MRKILIAALVSAVMAFGQGQSVNQTQGPPPYSWVSLLYYNGSSQIIYNCQAPAFGPLTTFSRAATTLTSVVVATNVGTITLSATAQFWVGQQVTIAGSTTAALNGAYKILTVSGSTATITTVGVSDATYNNAAMTLTTNAPMLNSPLWSIQAFSYASTNLATIYWAGTPSVSVPQGLLCSNRANY